MYTRNNAIYNSVKQIRLSTREIKHKKGYEILVDKSVYVYQKPCYL